MGYWGCLAVARSSAPLSQLAEAAILGTPVHEKEFGDEWRLLQATGATPDLHTAVRSLVGATGSPVLVSYVLDSDCGVIEAQTPDGSRWTALLNPAIAEQGYEMALDEYDSPATAIRNAEAWSQSGRLTPSENHLRTAFTDDGTFVEELFDVLLVGLGVPGAKLPADVS